TNRSDINRNLGLVFIVFLFYIALTVISTSDFLLFVPNSTVSLPILEIEIPLFYFYGALPGVVLMFHYNILANLQQHCAKLLSWYKSIESPSKEYLESLNPFLLNFFLAPLPPRIRMLLSFVIRLSLFILPQSLLFLILYRFAAYHSWLMTTWHMICVALGYRLLKTFSDNILEVVYWEQNQALYHRRLEMVKAESAEKAPQSVFRYRFKAEKVILGLSCAYYIHFLIMMLGLTPRYIILTAKTIHLLPSLNLEEQELVISQPELELVHFYTQQETDDPNRIEEKVYQFKVAYTKGYNLKGRDLRYANLNRTVLINADLREAKLEGADLNEADLQGANLERANLRESNLSNANLRGVNLNNVGLLGANLEQVNFIGSYAHDIDARLVNAESADFSGADLQRARFHGANLENAQLYGANLLFAKFQGANLDYAQLEGANFQNAKLQGASLRNVMVKNTGFHNAELDGSILQNIDLFRNHYGNLRIASVLYLREVLYTSPDSLYDDQIRTIASSIIDPDLKNSFIQRMRPVPNSAHKAYPIGQNLTRLSQPDSQYLKIRKEVAEQHFPYAAARMLKIDTVGQQEAQLGQLVENLTASLGPDRSEECLDLLNLQVNVLAQTGLYVVILIGVSLPLVGLISRENFSII
ncbi:MAG: pentapeptide repeat-containing protein, partial [Bacteroidia bacterium]|nr:pentapeptide repeat-containing protein [Bacteroidia bacterium]